MVEPNQVVVAQLRLSPSQQHYLYRVLRLGPGQQFLALDGRGRQWTATLTTVADVASLEPIAAGLPGPGAAMTLVMALPKGNGFDEVVRQATELGVTAIQPVISDRTLAQPNPKKLDRWQRIAAEATEQSERLLLPDLFPPLAWSEYLAQPSAGPRWLCVARGDAPHLLAVAQATDPGLPVVVAIGPEGGWTTAEAAAAVAAGFLPVSLGPHILRAVTAPLAALTLVAAARELAKSNAV